MEQSLILNQNNSDIYLINDKNISYYLSIPHSNEKINISINIMNTDNKETVIDFYKNFDYNIQCCITPIFNSNILNQLSSGNEQVFLSIDKYISYLINAGYKILKDNNKNIDNQIIMINNNTYSTFLKWFTTKYQNRVKCLDYNINTNISKTESPVTFTNTNETTPPLKTPITDEITKTIPVVDTVGEQKATSVLDNTQQIVTASETPTVQNKDLGFVSYVLLGVLVAVISLVLLYLLI